MEFTVKIADQVIAEDPEMQRFMEALQPLVDRMATSHFKYGNLRNKYPHSASALKSGQKRIANYEQSGNTEDCLDAANFLIIEHVLPSHPSAHFRAQGSHESPGIVWTE